MRLLLNKIGRSCRSLSLLKGGGFFFFQVFHLILSFRFGPSFYLKTASKISIQRIEFSLEDQI